MQKAEALRLADAAAAKAAKAAVKAAEIERRAKIKAEAAAISKVG